MDNRAPLQENQSSDTRSSFGPPMLSASNIKPFGAELPVSEQQLADLGARLKALRLHSPPPLGFKSPSSTQHTLLQSQVRKARADLATSEAKVRKADAEIKDLELALSKEITTREETAQKEKHLIRQLGKARVDLDMALNAKAQAEQERSIQALKVKDLEDKVEEKHTEYVELSKKFYQNVTESASKGTQLFHERQMREEIVAEFESKIELINAEVEKKNQHIETLRSQADEFTSSYVELARHCENVGAKITAGIGRTGEIARIANQKINSLNRQNLEKSRECDEFVAELQTTRKKLADKTEELKAVNDKLDKMTKQQLKDQTPLAAATSKVEELKKELQHEKGESYRKLHDFETQLNNMTKQLTASKEREKIEREKKEPVSNKSFDAQLNSVRNQLSVSRVKEIDAKNKLKAAEDRAKELLDGQSNLEDRLQDTITKLEDQKKALFNAEQRESNVRDRLLRAKAHNSYQYAQIESYKAKLAGELHTSSYLENSEHNSKSTEGPILSSTLQELASTHKSEGLETLLYELNNNASVKLNDGSAQPTSEQLIALTTEIEQLKAKLQNANFALLKSQEREIEVQILAAHSLETARVQREKLEETEERESRGLESYLANVQNLNREIGIVQDMIKRLEM